MTAARTYNNKGDFLHGPTPENNDPEEHREGSTHSNNVHLDWDTTVQPRHPGTKRSSGLTGRPADVTLGNLFLENQLASLSFRDFWKNVVDGLIGFVDVPLFGLDLLEERLVGF